MTDTQVQAPTRRHGKQDVPPQERTKVIILSQVLTIVALFVLWSLIRSKRAARADA